MAAQGEYRRWVVAIRWFVAAVVVSAGVVLQLTAVQAHRDQVRASAAAESDRRQDGDRTVELADASVELDGINGQARAAADALDVVRSQLAAVGSSEAAVTADVSAAQAALARLEDDVTTATANLGASGLQLVAIRDCVVSGQQALDMAASSSTGSAAKSLDSARAACDASATLA
jgi:hypothetical protein